MFYLLSIKILFFMKRILFTLAIFLGLSYTSAQETGSFLETVDFEELDYTFSRNLYYYVPENYDPANTYKLVVGFRGGPHANAGQFRDQLTFLSNELNAIVLCPENEAHFNNEEGLVKQLFQYSVAHTMETYNIDPEYIYLTGLSYGGRHAVIVAMDTDNGDIPTLRGVIPFAAGSNSHLEPNYDAIENFPPACVCIGLDDSSNFQTVSNTLAEDISENGGDVLLNEISGVGHTVAFPEYPDEMIECINFIEGINTNVSIVELANEQLIIYPNPAKEMLSFNVSGLLAIEKIIWRDLKGSLIKTTYGDTKNIDVSELAEGLLMLEIHTNKGLITKRVSIMR